MQQNHYGKSTDNDRKAANLDYRYWAEAVNTSVYLKNRSPTKAVANMTPEEAWTGLKPDVSHLRIFGSQAFLHIPDQQRKKLDSKTRQMILVGYCEDSKAYRLMNPEEYSGKVYKGRDVDFIEITDKSHQNIENTTDNVQKDIEINPLYKQKDETQEDETPESEEEESQGENTLHEESFEWEDTQNTTDNVQEDRRYPLRTRKPKEMITGHDYISSHL